MRLLIFDTETNGLPKSKIISPDTLHLWPHILQMSYLIYDVSKNEITEIKDDIIEVSEDILITEEVTNINGIDKEMTSTKGKPIMSVLNNFFHFLRNTDKLIGHNIEFDLNMIKIELLRLIYNKTLDLTKEQLKLYKSHLHYINNYKNISCTLKESIKFCNIQQTNRFGEVYLKYPKLNELYEKLFSITANNLHNSLNDVFVTLRCYMKLNNNIDLLDSCETFSTHFLEKKL
jgi:DNA polymerase III epsilon subunit-like protein